MWLDDYLTKHLKEGEEPLKVVRPYGLTIVPSVLGGAVVILLDFFLLAWWLQWKSGGLLGFGIVFLLGAIWAGRALFLWSRNILILTNHRIIDIDQRGILHRTVAEAPYQKIQDVRYSTQGLWQTMFHFGTVIIQTAGNTTNLELTQVRDPQRVQQMITDIQQEIGERGPDQPGDVGAAIEALRKALMHAPGATPRNPLAGRRVPIDEDDHA